LYKSLIKIFDVIVHFEKINNNKFCLNFALFAPNFEDFFYIFIVIVYANTNIFIVIILKFVNITFEQNKKIHFIFIFEIFYLRTLDFVIQLNTNIANIIEFVYKYKFYNIDVNKIVFSTTRYNNNSIKRCFNFCANAKNI